MLGLRWHRFSGGRAAGPARAQDLSAALQALSWPGPSKVGPDEPANALWVSGGVDTAPERWQFWLGFR
jgi:hypothetical protein